MTREKICRSFALFVLATAVCGASGYAQIQKSPDKNKPADGSARTKPVSNDDASFLGRAIEVNYAEIELGGLAPTRTQTPRVKSYAEMLVKDHSALLPKFQAMEPGGSTEKPQLSADHDKLKMRLSGLKGAEFDREYIDAMVAGHREAVAMFERQAASKATTPPVKAKSTDKSPTEMNKLVRDTLPMMKKHLEQAEQIQKSLAQPVKKSSTK